MLVESADRLATADGARFTVKVSFLVVSPSEAVTNISIEFGPTANGIDPDNVPEATGVPFTNIVAPGSTAVGLSKTEATLLASATV